MTKVLPPVVLPSPRPLVGLAADTMIAGSLIPAIERIKIFSDEQWEDFVLEWGDSLREEYERVERCGGAGDMGRDIIAFVKGGGGQWDNYQCKHLRDPLAPSVIWIELGKLVYYTRRGDYTYPRRYSFVAPLGAGTKLSNLLKKPEVLRRALIDEWDGSCRDNITKLHSVVLDNDLRTYIEGLDFSIFDATPPFRLIDAHAKTRWHVARFGGGLPPRPTRMEPPADLAATEVTYVRQLLDAYGDHLKCGIASTADLTATPEIKEHFDDSRVEFYSAESLRAFSRDTLPPGEFEKLQDEVHFGIKDELRAEHPDGYRRVLAVVKTSRTLSHAGHSLHQRLAVRDHGGICHQLSNDKKLKWTK